MKTWWPRPSSTARRRTRLRQAVGWCATRWSATRTSTSTRWCRFHLPAIGRPRSSTCISTLPNGTTYQQLAAASATTCTMWRMLGRGVPCARRRRPARLWTEELRRNDWRMWWAAAHLDLTAWWTWTERTAVRPVSKRSCSNRLAASGEDDDWEDVMGNLNLWPSRCGGCRARQVVRTWVCATSTRRGGRRWTSAASTPTCTRRVWKSRQGELDNELQRRPLLDQVCRWRIRW